jgi:hypothetical protein
VSSLRAITQGLRVLEVQARVHFPSSPLAGVPVRQKYKYEQRKINTSLTGIVKIGAFDDTLSVLLKSGQLLCLRRQSVL